MNLKKYTIDFRDVQYFFDIHKIIQKSLHFPENYGCNWSAFWDCLTDMYGEPMHIEIIGIDVIARKFEDAASKIISILKRFKHYEKTFENDILIEIIINNAHIKLI